MSGFDATGLQHRVDHAVEAEGASVVGGEDAGDAAPLQLGDLLRDDDAAAAAEHPHVARAALPQELHHVGEELHVAALVGGHRDPLGVLLDRGVHDLGDRAVVAEVDHLGAARLQQPADDVDRGVMPVEQRRGGHEAVLPLRRGRFPHVASLPATHSSATWSVAVRLSVARLSGTPCGARRAPEAGAYN